MQKQPYFFVLSKKAWRPQGTRLRQRHSGRMLNENNAGPILQPRRTAIDYDAAHLRLVTAHQDVRHYGRLHDHRLCNKTALDLLRQARFSEQDH